MLEKYDQFVHLIDDAHAYCVHYTMPVHRPHLAILNG